MADTPLVYFATTDLCAITRGRAFPRASLPSFLQDGCGWVPANSALTAFDAIGDNPAGSFGDLRMYGDPEAAALVPAANGRHPFTLMPGDLRRFDGEPWAACPRHFLKDALAALASATGLELTVAFEHEFTLLDAPASAAFSLQRHVHSAEFVEALWAALEQAGVCPEMILPEFGAGQFEVTMTPAPALRAADRAVVLREVVRTVAHSHGLRVSFAPKVTPQAVANGVHIHFSLTRGAQPVMYDPAGLGGLSGTAQSFCAGIVARLPEFIALAAGTGPSYLRLQPHSWSAAVNAVSRQNRESTLRVCPAPTPRSDPARAHHVEYRAADATGNPYLVLGALARAGADGIASSAQMAPLYLDDAGALTPERLAALPALPSRLDDALRRLLDSAAVRAWSSGPELWAYLEASKRVEMASVRDLDDTQACRRYAAVY